MQGTENLTEKHAVEWLESGIPSCSEIESRFGLWSKEKRYRRLISGKDRDLESVVTSFMCREAFVSHVGFGVPCREVIDLMISEGPILEIGAGTGYWSALLQNYGGDVVAADKCSGVSQHGQQIGKFFNVMAMDGPSAVEAYPERNVLMVWPSLDDDWSADAAAKMKPGRRLFLASEGMGGAVGTDALFECIHDTFERPQFHAIPSWHAINDFFAVFTKKAGAANQA